MATERIITGKALECVFANLTEHLHDLGIDLYELDPELRRRLIDAFCKRTVIIRDRWNTAAACRWLDGFCERHNLTDS